MVSVSRTFSWASPFVLSEMYCDRKDVFGIMFWYDDVVAQNKELKNKK